MQPLDLVTLYVSINGPKKPDDYGLTPDFIKSSEKRLSLLGLIDAKSSQVYMDRVQIFLTEALPFWWPMGEEMKTLVSVHPKTPLQEEFQNFISWIEVLRNHTHPAKKTTQQKLVEYLKNKRGPAQFFSVHSIQNPEGFSDDDKQSLIQHVCHNGYKSLTLVKASVLLHRPLRFFYRNWETDQALRLWVAAQTHEEFFQFLAPLLGQIYNFNKGHLAAVLERYLDFIETHEVYYRLCLWGYLENDPAIQEMFRRSQLDFFKTIQVLFKKSKPEARKKAEFYAYLFTTTWKLYAGLVWCDSKTLGRHLDVSSLRASLKTFIIESVFEGY